MFTTSYKTEEQRDFITSFVRLINPKTVVEIGTQQGCSAITIGRGLQPESRLVTFDLFEPKYDKPPYSNTHACKQTAIMNIAAADLDCYWQVIQGSHHDVISHVPGLWIDLLHIDICNHYDNIEPILGHLAPFTKEALIIEGGIYNHWQKKHGYRPWHPVLDEAWFRTDWRAVVVPLSDEGNAVTLATRK